MGRTSSSLKELRSLREAVVAEEKAKTQALLQNLPENQPPVAAPVPVPAAPPALEEPATEAVSPTIPDSTPSPTEAPAIEPVPARSTVAPALVAAPNRSKAGKELTLIIPLTPRIQERLQRHVENARWSPAELVMELIRVSLHQGYPAIQYGDELIAKAGTYRTFERNPLESVLKIVSGQGVFSVKANPDSQECRHWLSYFTNQRAADPEKSASQVCLFTLQSYLENVEDFKLQGWTKNIQTDAFMVTPAS